VCEFAGVNPAAAKAPLPGLVGDNDRVRRVSNPGRSRTTPRGCGHADKRRLRASMTSKGISRDFALVQSPAHWWRATNQIAK
jgi:hypothetical protein